jgi:hypothetical protein
MLIAQNHLELRNEFRLYKATKMQYKIKWSYAPFDEDICKILRLKYRV